MPKNLKINPSQPPKSLTAIRQLKTWEFFLFCVYRIWQILVRSIRSVGHLSSFVRPFPSLFLFWASRLMAFCLLYPSSFSWLLRILHSEILQECVLLSFAETGVIDRKTLELANPLLLQRYTWIKSQKYLSFYFLFFYQHLFFTVSPEKRRGKSKKLSPSQLTRVVSPAFKKGQEKSRKKTILFSLFYAGKHFCSPLLSWHIKAERKNWVAGFPRKKGMPSGCKLFLEFHKTLIYNSTIIYGTVDASMSKGPK